MPLTPEMLVAAACRQDNLPTVKGRAYLCERCLVPTSQSPPTPCPPRSPAADPDPNLCHPAPPVLVPTKLPPHPDGGPPGATNDAEFSSDGTDGAEPSRKRPKTSAKKKSSTTTSASF